MRRLSLLVALVAISLFGALLVLSCGDGEDADDNGETPQATVKPTTVATAAAKPIVIDEPLPRAEVTSPLTVSGTASVFEGNVIVVLKDAAGKTLAQTSAQASEGAPGRGSFEAELEFAPPDQRTNGIFEAYWPSAKDGTPQDIVTVPVVLLP